MNQTNPLPFHKWRDSKVKELGHVRQERVWYYTEYGAYCNRFRSQQMRQGLNEPRR